jgi:hypothetical protein
LGSAQGMASNAGLPGPRGTSVRSEAADDSGTRAYSGLGVYSGRRPYLRDAGIPGDRGGSPDDLNGAPGDPPAPGASRFSGDPRTCGEPRVSGPFGASAAPAPATPASYASAADAYAPDVPAPAAPASDGPGGATVRLPASSSTQAGGPIWADGPPPLRPAVAREMPTAEPAPPPADDSDRWTHPPIDASPLNGPPAVRHWTEPLDDTQRRARQSAARRYE